VRLLRTRAELLSWRHLEPDRPLHFVPTMGALHGGHQSLLRRAAERLDGRRPRVLLSVFVNPLQFGAGEDFERYPRDLERDGQLAAEAGAEALFAPELSVIYPDGPEGGTRVLAPAPLQRELCARSRPGHFDGVATVVCRLLALVRPDRLLLGEKDWQQLVILRRVVADLGLPLTVQGCATMRGEGDLALSSRNRYLQGGERQQALALPAALRDLGAAAAPGAPAGPLLALVRQRLQEAGLAIDYVQLTAAHTLRPLPRVEGLSLLAAAVHCGSARLIDHVFLMPRPPIVAIDGPAGAGKSTVTRALAARLGLVYLDTGAMYRAVTWWVMRQGADPASAEAVAPLLQNLDLQLSRDADGGQRVSVNGQDVSEAIRSPEVTALVSQVAAHGCVREALTDQQRRLGEKGALVAEGRDIGTAVFPDADCKVFLTATVSERARRRAEDLRQRGFAVPPLQELEASIAERDRLDSSREVAPLQQAEDAVELITDGLSIDAVIQALVDLFREKVPEEAWPGPGGQPRA
jgi:pantoate ligase/cytidylate kinase